MKFMNPKSHKVKLIATISRVSKRTMHTTRNIANKAVNMHLIRHTAINETTRNMACFHGVKLKPAAPKPIVHDIDVTGYHPVVTKTTCTESSCKSVNCADPNEKNANCPSRTAQQNQTSIPPTAQGFKTEVAANLTSKVPVNKKGVLIDANQNYSGQNKPQQMVVETNAVTVSSNDLYIHNKSNTFVQGHHQIIDNNIP